MVVRATFSRRVFDARPDRLDLRDLPYRPPVRSLPARYPDDRTTAAHLSGYVKQGLILDQGMEGACTGFGLACVANYLLWVRHAESGRKTPFSCVSPRMLYEMAKRYDEWPGQDYDGSSCRGALKGWHKHGVCSAALWPYTLDRRGKPVFERPKAGWDADAATRPLGVYYRVDRRSVVDLQAAIADGGAVYVSADVHDGWDRLLRERASRAPTGHEALPSIPAPKRPRDLGGHAFAIVGYNERGFVVQNSWGRLWGASGFGVLPYDDWVQHATDAWVCALGVPVVLPDATGRARRLKASRWRVASGSSLNTIAAAARNPANPPDDPWPVDHPFDYAPYQPWSTDAAYEQTLVSGNDGDLVVGDVTRASSDAEGYARETVCDRPAAWAEASGATTLKLALYAHGGLNSESASIRRIRVLGPYFAANGIYPLFLTWKTGAGETIRDMVEDWSRRVFGVEAERVAGILDELGAAKDRAVEAVARTFGRGAWSEMRDNARLGADPGHALDLLAENLMALELRLASTGKKLELHCVAHSAGSILFGHLFDRLRAERDAETRLSVRTCTLFAAACSTRFAADHYLPAAKANLLDLRRLWLHYLTDENEKRDGLPSPDLAVYGKSLLYLVSRALDDRRKMPLLGMERALLSSYAKDSDQWDARELASITAWQRAWGTATSANQRAVPVTGPDVEITKNGGRIPATHGSFDNSIEGLTRAISRIKGTKLVAPMEWLDY